MISQTQSIGIQNAFDALTRKTQSRCHTGQVINGEGFTMKNASQSPIKTFSHESSAIKGDGFIMYIATAVPKIKSFLSNFTGFEKINVEKILKAIAKMTK